MVDSTVVINEIESRKCVLIATDKMSKLASEFRRRRKVPNAAWTWLINQVPTRSIDSTKC